MGFNNRNVFRSEVRRDTLAATHISYKWKGCGKLQYFL